MGRRSLASCHHGISDSLHVNPHFMCGVAIPGVPARPSLASALRAACGCGNGDHSPHPCGSASGQLRCANPHHPWPLLRLHPACPKELRMGSAHPFGESFADFPIEPRFVILGPSPWIRAAIGDSLVSRPLLPRLELIWYSLTLFLNSLNCSVGLRKLQLLPLAIFSSPP